MQQTMVMKEGGDGYDIMLSNNPSGQLYPGDGILDSLRRQWTGKEFSSRF